VAHRIATAMLFLDDATVENGCLEVAAGTHTVGKWTQRDDADDPDAQRMSGSGERHEAEPTVSGGHFGNGLPVVVTQVARTRPLPLKPCPAVR